MFRFLCFVCFICGESLQQNIVSVGIESAIINGLRETTRDGNELNVFRGIPFAEPPIGDLRFRRPLPKRRWPREWDAFEMSANCVQNANIFGVEKSVTNKSFSEDCLYLNVWSPNNESPKAVMVWIHGG
ncbi:unnamed protein product, partial [Medioppia subpectinata]